MPTTDAMSKQRSRNWAWFWLAYTGFLFIDPIFDPSLWMWSASTAVFLTFLGIFVLYVRSTDTQSPLRYAMIVATFLLGLVTFPWNQGASSLFVYAAAFLPFTIESVRRVIALIFAELLIVLAEGYYCTVHVAPHTLFHIGWPNTFIALFLMVVVGGGNIFWAEQRRADCKLRLAQEENMALAAVAERERIARDLHDVLGHTLSLIVLKAELAGRLIDLDPARAAAECGDVERTARTALAEVREAIGGYRARGLAAEIEAARRTLDAADVVLTVDDAPATFGTLTAAEETALALVLREAVTNIVRHARATTCQLCFVSEGGQRRLILQDNGHHAVTREGNGLRGMRERIESLGGHLQLERGSASRSDLTSGTRLLIDLPHHPEAA
jgi:two-component system sensor histidine kinase DesK